MSDTRDAVYMCSSQFGTYPFFIQDSTRRSTQARIVQDDHEKRLKSNSPSEFIVSLACWILV